MHCCRIVNGIKNKNIKNSLDDNMEYWQKVHQIPQTILDGRDAILRVRVKWLIFNMVSQLWADVKYHVPTRFGFSPKRTVFILLAMPPTS